MDCVTRGSVYVTIRLGVNSHLPSSQKPDYYPNKVVAILFSVAPRTLSPVSPVITNYPAASPSYQFGASYSWHTLQFRSTSKRVTFRSYCNARLRFVSVAVAHITVGSYYLLRRSMEPRSSSRKHCIYQR